MSLTVLMCSIGVLCYAQNPGTFTATGSMNTARDEHTATLLANGKLLIAGGSKSTTSNSTLTLASAELYDPSAGTFSPTGNMTVARLLHSATLLADGRVLIAGGYSTFPAQQSLASAELYDPSTGTFTATGSMLTAGAGNATLLANGKVLIAHDPTLSDNPIAAEVYDPATGTFFATGNQNTNPNDTSQTAALLPNGRVILVACCAQIQLYDPASGAFSLTNVAGLLQNLAQNFDFTMTLLTNGKFLFSGGCSCEGTPGDFVSASVSLYDPSTGTAAATGTMTTSRTLHSATQLPDGTVLIAGGLKSTNSRDFNGTTELYDPVSGTFSRSGDMITGRYDHSATLLRDGRVLIAGGLGGLGAAFGYLDSAEIYTPTVLVPAPVLFSLSGDGQGAIWHATTGQIASSQDPATGGDILSMYTTSLFEGGVIPPQVSIGGQLAEVLFFGDAPGYPGYYQVNFLVPDGVPTGPAVPVRLTYIGRSSNELTIGVQ